jgi:hypothetical protein
MSPEEREKKRLWMVEYNRRKKAEKITNEIETLNTIYGTNFSVGQHIVYGGRRYTITGIHGRFFTIKDEKIETLAHPLDIYPAIKLTVTDERLEMKSKNLKKGLK